MSLIKSKNSMAKEREKRMDSGTRGRITGFHVSHLSPKKHESPLRALESAFLV